MGNTLSASERVKLRREVAQLFGDCASGFVFPIKYKYIVEESAAAGVAVLFSVPKRLHKRANKRNLLRRRMRESEELINGAKEICQRAIIDALDNDINDWGELKNIMKNVLARYIFNKTKRKPVILPILMDI